MRTNSNIFLDPGDTGPELRQVWIAAEGRPQCTVDIGIGMIFAVPQDLWEYATRLAEVAEEACRRANALTDEPLPGIAS